jgi:hypothetical protein
MWHLRRGLMNAVALQPEYQSQSCMPSTATGTAPEPCSAVSTKTLSRIVRCFVDGTIALTISNKLPSKTEFIDDFGDIDPEVKTIAYSAHTFHHLFKQKELPPTWPSARASHRRGHALLTAAPRPW